MCSRLESLLAKCRYLLALGTCGVSKGSLAGGVLLWLCGGAGGSFRFDSPAAATLLSGRAGAQLHVEVIIELHAHLPNIITSVHPRFTAHHTAAPATPPAITPSSSTSPAAPSYTDSTRSSRRQRTALLPSWPTRRPPILPPPRAMVASDAAYPRVEMDIAEPVTPAGSTSGAPRKAKEEYIISKLADQDFDMSKHPLFLSSLSSSLPFPSLPSCTLRQASPPSFVREYEGPTRR